MSNEKMFEVATRRKMRFPFKGQISLEDLWDLSVKDLDIIYKTLNSKLKKVEEDSLLQDKSKEDKEVEVKVKIVKLIFKTKLEEAETKEKAKASKAKKEKIQNILAIKQDEALQNKSPEKLKEMLKELQ